MRCPKCKSEMELTRGVHHYRESGLKNIWLENWPIFVCRKCKTKLPLLLDPDKTSRAITRALVSEKGRLDGDSIVFLRRAMRLTTEALGRVLGVDRVTVTRWENNKRRIQGQYDYLLRHEAINRILPQDVQPGVRDAVNEIVAGGYRPELSVGEAKIQVAIEPPALLTQILGKATPLSQSTVAGLATGRGTDNRR